MATTTNGAIDRIIELLAADITHIGVGNGSTPLDATSTLLDNEMERKISTNIIDGTTIIAEGYWDETEANGVTYIEGGCFCDGASLSINTGTLFTGGLINVAKDNTQSLTVSVEITVEAVNS